jgi:predicted ATPase
MAQVIASTLGVIPRAGLPLIDSIVEFLRLKELLLVLDNCEHLLGAAAHISECALRRSPGVKLLATSREGLGVTGEQMWPLRSLSVPDDTQTEDDLVGSEAVRLFLERARAAEPLFAPRHADLVAIGEICRRLDGIPLAIELAAARVVAMSPAEIASLLDERFRLLTGGRRTAVERHQTLRATVDWSYSLLDERAKTVFRRLGVFAGGFDAAAAQSVASGDGVEAWDVVDALTDLVAKSMLVVERTPHGTRYQLLETMRAYGRELLDDAGEADVWRRRHAQCYASLAEDIAVGIVGPNETAWLRRLIDDVDNLRAAVVWALDRSAESDRDCAFRIAGALAFNAVNYGEIGVLAWAEWCVERARDEGLTVPAVVWAAAGWNAIEQGDWVTAVDRADNALARRNPTDVGAAFLSFLTLACVESFRGNHEAARRTIALAVDAAQARGDAVYETGALASSATFAAMAGDFDSARRHADDALALAQAVGNPTALAGAWAAVGWARWNDDPERALEAITESRRLRHGGSVFGPVISIAAVIQSRAGQSHAALIDLRDALGYSADAGLRATVLSALDRAVIVMANVGNPECAAVLGGAVTSGPLAALDTITFAVEGSMRADALAAVRERLGTTRYQGAIRRGAAMNYEELVDYALAEIDRTLQELDSGDA